MPDVSAIRETAIMWFNIGVLVGAVVFAGTLVMMFALRLKIERSEQDSK